MDARAFWVKFRGKTEYEFWRARNRLQRRRFVHFLHISKTGGTAIKHALENNRITDKYAIVLHNHEKKLCQVPNGEFAFFILRDPVTRFVSAFRARYRQERPRYDTPWTAVERVAFQEFHTPNELAIALSSSDQGKRARAVAAIQGINRVNQSYTEWFASTDELFARAPDILFIGFQETLSTDFERLKVILGLPNDLALPSDPVAANRAPCRTAPDLDEIAIDNLRAWYARDYELFAACRELRAEQDTRTAQT